MRTLTGWLSALIVVALMVHITAGVIARYVFGVTLNGVVEQTQFVYMVGLTFLPLAMARHRRQLTTVDLITESKRLSHRNRAILMTTILVLSAVISFALMWYSGERTIQAFIDKESQTNLSSPLWVSRLALPVGLFFLGVQFLAEVVGMHKRSDTNSEYEKQYKTEEI